MWIGGLQKLSLIDYPGKLACVIFTRGCNFRCRYCHNPELVLPDKFCPVVPEHEVMDFLMLRTEYLDGVVISGGEPTIQEDLIPFLDKLKHIGYLIKLDTNGSRPDVLRRLIDLKRVDYIAMDVKAPLHRYRETIAVDFPPETIEESIHVIIKSGIEHEFRTTVVKHLCTDHDVCEIASMIGSTQKYHLQKARIDENILDKGLYKHEQYSEDEFNQLTLSLAK
jgi:pyruvate formate lyase activating enzyme